MSESQPVSETQNPQTPQVKTISLGELYTLPKGKAYIQVPDETTPVWYDFLFGCRVSLPRTDKTRFFVQIEDVDKKLVVYSQIIDTNRPEFENGATVTTEHKYYHRYHILVKRVTDDTTLLDHTYNAKDQVVVINCPDAGLGDCIGWFSNAVKFQKKWGCKLVFAAPAYICSLFEKTYPNIDFVRRQEIFDKYPTPYAMYYPGLFFDNSKEFQPEDFRQVGIHTHVASILGVTPEDFPPKVDTSAPRQIKEKYVVIACNASSHCKHWNYPGGWDEVIEYLKSRGYRVLCIDKDKNLYRGHGVCDTMPHGCEDFTGDIPLQERVNIIKDADFFIGVSSGLSWVAWCCNVPVVLISGFTHPYTEFRTKYRVINMDVCNSCWNDPRCAYDHNDPLGCPRLKGTASAYECSMYITPKMVIDAVDKCIADNPKDTIA